MNRVAHTPDADHLTYPVPIRPDVIVRIANLPRDLTKAEAERIAAVVLALAQPAPGVAGTSGGCTAHVECLGQKCMYAAPSRPAGVIASDGSQQ